MFSLEQGLGLLGVPVEADRAEPSQGVGNKLMIVASEAERSQREGLDVCPRRQKLRSFDLDALAGTEDHECVEKGGNAVNPRTRPRLEVVDEPLNLVHFIAGECEAE